MAGSDSTASSESLSRITESRKSSYWAHIVSHYEKRNASLEQRQTELAERIRLMECAVPSLLMGAMVSMKRNSDSITKISSSPKTNEQTSTRRQSTESPDGKELRNSLGKGNTDQLRRTGYGKSELNRFCKNIDLRP